MIVKNFSAFANIITNIRPYQLTEWVQQHLVAVAQVFNKGHNVNYAFFMAFNNLMKNMELIRRIYGSLSGGYDNYECTRVEFTIAAQRISQLTPLEGNYEIPDLRLSLEQATRRYQT